MDHVANDLGEVSKSLIPPIVHLPAKGLKNSTKYRANKLKEVPDPSDLRTSKIFEVLEFLDVENSRRYSPCGADAFCNVYVYDFCCLCGLYFPRVWWIEPTKATSHTPVIRGSTVVELRANDLYDWFVKWGEYYGWSVETCLPGRTTAAIAKIQGIVDKSLPPSLGIIVGRRYERNKNGHVSIVLPQNKYQGWVVEICDGEMLAPLQSQAGVLNKKVCSSKWFDDSYKFDSVCFAVCALP